jgi:hypothetical protein
MFLKLGIQIGGVKYDPDWALARSMFRIAPD